MPFVIGVVRLDAGPELETILVCNDESELVIGSRVCAVLVEGEPDPEGPTEVDCRFAPTTERTEA